MVSIRHNVSVLIFNENKSSILMVNDGRKWSLIRGGVEEGETIQDAACRETWEESGQILRPEDIGALIAFNLINTRKGVQIRWLVEAYPQEFRELTGRYDPDHEIRNVKWFPLEEFPYKKVGDKWQGHCLAAYLETGSMCAGRLDDFLRTAPEMLIPGSVRQIAPHDPALCFASPVYSGR